MDKSEKKEQEEQEEMPKDPVSPPMRFTDILLLLIMYSIPII